MDLHGDSIPRLSGNERNFLDREVLHISHAHHFLIFFREALDQDDHLFSVQGIEKACRVMGIRFEAFFDKDVERNCFMFSIFVNDKIVQYVVEEGLHNVDLSSAQKVLPRFQKGFLYQVFACLAAAYFRKSTQVKFPSVVVVCYDEQFLALFFLLWGRHEYNAVRGRAFLQRHYGALRRCE